MLRGLYYIMVRTSGQADVLVKEKSSVPTHNSIGRHEEISILMTHHEYD